MKYTSPQYEIVGENAILYRSALDKILVSKVLLNYGLLDRFWKIFGKGKVLYNKYLKEYAKFYERDVYLPRLLSRGEEIQLVADGGRSCINKNRTLTLNLFGKRQTFMEKRKGVGTAFFSYLEHKRKLANFEKSPLSQYEDTLILNTEYSFRRPVGAQRKDYALNELRASETLFNLQVKHAPVLAVFPIPPNIQTKIETYTRKYFFDQEFPHKTTLFQEVILFPSNLRALHPSGSVFYNAAENLGVDSEEIIQTYLNDLLKFLEIIPKTLKKRRAKFTYMGFEHWNGFLEDCVITPTGLYISDLESFGRRTVDKLVDVKVYDAISSSEDLSSSFRKCISDFASIIKRIILRGNIPSEKDLILHLDRSEYFKVKKRNGVLRVEVKCESGINFCLKY